MVASPYGITKCTCNERMQMLPLGHFESESPGEERHDRRE